MTAVNLLKMTNFVNCPARVIAHASPVGVINCRNISDMTEDNILLYLKKFGGILMKSSTFMLTYLILYICQQRLMVDMIKYLYDLIFQILSDVWNTKNLVTQNLTVEETILAVATMGNNVKMYSNVLVVMVSTNPRPVLSGL